HLISLWFTCYLLLRVYLSSVLVYVSTSILIFFFFSLLRRPPISTLFPYTTLFRSHGAPQDRRGHVRRVRQRDPLDAQSLQRFVTLAEPHPVVAMHHDIRAVALEKRRRVGRRLQLDDVDEPERRHVAHPQVRVLHRRPALVRARPGIAHHADDEHVAELPSAP